MTTITGGHSKQDQILLVNIGKYTGFCMCLRSYLIWPPVITTRLVQLVGGCKGASELSRKIKIKSDQKYKDGKNNYCRAATSAADFE